MKRQSINFWTSCISFEQSNTFLKSKSVYGVNFLGSILRSSIRETIKKTQCYEILKLNVLRQLYISSTVASAVLYICSIMRRFRGLRCLIVNFDLPTVTILSIKKGMDVNINIITDIFLVKSQRQVGSGWMCVILQNWRISCKEVTAPQKAQVSEFLVVAQNRLRTTFKRRRMFFVVVELRDRFDI